MKIKLIKETQINDEVLPVGSIIEIGDEIGQPMVDDGSAELYTEEVESQEETDMITEAAKSLKAEEKALKTEPKGFETKGNEIMSTETKTFKLGEAVKKSIETNMVVKAVDAFDSTQATPVGGIISEGSTLYAKAKNRAINHNGTLNLVYTAALSGSGIGPDISVVAESTAAATTVPLEQYEAIPAKWFATVPIANEYIDDVEYMEGAVQEELQKEAGRVLDYNILNGSFTSNKGFKGIVGDTVHSQEYDMSSIGGVTKGNLETMMSKVLPESQDNAMWTVSPNFWAACQTALLDTNNVGGQLMKDGKDKELYGYPVHVTAGATTTANPAVFGDMGTYTVGIDKDIEIETDRSSGFLTDTTNVKVRARVAGGLQVSPRYYNNTTYTSTVYAKVSA